MCNVHTAQHIAMTQYEGRSLDVHADRNPSSYPHREQHCIRLHTTHICTHTNNTNNTPVHQRRQRCPPYPKPQKQQRKVLPVRARPRSSARRTASVDLSLRCVPYCSGLSQASPSTYILLFGPHGHLSVPYSETRAPPSTYCVSSQLVTVCPIVSSLLKISKSLPPGASYIVNPIYQALTTLLIYLH